MRLKELLAALLPPALVGLFRKRPWKGVYRTFAEVPVSGPGFDGGSWLRMLRAERDKVERSLRSSGFAESFNENDLLALVVATSGRRNGGKVRIVDFGGGAGISFLQLSGALPPPVILEYHVVERAPVCEDGNAHFRSDPRIRFHADIPRDLDRPDIVYIRTALQYLEKYQDVLGKLLDLQPEHLLLTNFSGTLEPTFATAQLNQKGSRIPYLFINLSELESFMSGRGYSLAYRSGIENRYRQGGLPKKFRSRFVYNLLFSGTP